MDDDYKARRAAEKAALIANSPFKVDSYVAVVNTHWSRRIDGKRRIAKVYKNGNIILYNHDGSVGTHQYNQSSHSDGSYYAHEVGNQYSRTHLEPWSEKIEQEIATRKEERRTQKRIDAIIERLKDGEKPLSISLDIIENTLDIKSNPETE
jgi:Txe/YoeB family toxin of Txe-Axe toxin-antitoxin module